MNIWEKMRRKKGLTRVEIAKEMGISEEKVKEVEKNMRTMPKNEIDKYIKSIHNMSNGERELKIAEAKSWYEITDFKSLMKEFGFTNQNEVAKAIGVDPSSISVWFNKKDGDHKIGTNGLLKLYYFFNNEFNKKISTPEPVVEIKINKNVEVPTDRKILLNWYNNFDMKKGIRELGFKDQKSFALATGFPQGSISDWCRKACLPNTGKLIRLYEIFNGKEETKVEEPTINVDTTSIVEEEPINISNFMPKENVTVFKGTEPISISVLSPEEMGQKATVFKPSDLDDIVYNNFYQYIPEEPTHIEEPTSELKEDTTKDLILENRELKQRIARYETLIDIIISKSKEN